MAGDLDLRLGVTVSASGDGAQVVTDDLARVEQAAVSAQQEIAAAAATSASASESAAGGMRVLAAASRDAEASAEDQGAAAESSAAGLRSLAEAGAQAAAASRVAAEGQAAEAAGVRKLAEETAKLTAENERQQEAQDRGQAADERSKGLLGSIVEWLRRRRAATKALAEEQKKLNDETDKGARGIAAFAGAFDKANAAASSHLATAAHLKQAAEPILSASRQLLGATWGTVQSGVGLDAMLGDASAASGMDYARLSALSASVADGSTRSQTDIAAAVQALAKRGFREDRITESALSDVVRFSTITGMGATEAAGMLASASNGTGEDMGRMTDMLLSASDPATIARLFSLVGPKARAAGYGAADVALLTEALGQRGYEGEKAGEALNGMFLAVNDPNRKKFMRRLGVTGKESGAAEMLSNIAAKTDGMDEKRLSNLLRNAFGEGAPAITALLTDVESLKKRDAELRDDGQLAAAAKLKEETTDGAARALDQLASSVERLKESLTKNAIVQGVLTASLKALTGLVDAMSWMAEHCPALSAAAVGLAGGFGALLAALGGVAVVGSAVSTIAGLKKYLETMRALDAAFFRSAVSGRATARGIGMAAAKFLVVAYAAEALCKNFEVVKGAIVGLIGHFQGLSVRIDEWFWDLGKSFREFFGINDSEEKDASMRAEFADRKQSALDKLQRGQDAMAALEAAGGWQAALDPTNTGYAQKVQTHLDKAQRERAAKEGGEKTSLAITVKNDTVQAQATQGGKTVTLNARAGLVAVGAI